jgi:hypothetical protein
MRRNRKAVAAATELQKPPAQNTAAGGRADHFTGRSVGKGKDLSIRGVSKDVIEK